MRGRTSYRRKRNKKSLVLMTILFWAVSAVTVMTLVNQGSALAGTEEAAEETLAMQYVDHIFSVVSRGSDRSEKPADGQNQLPGGNSGSQIADGVAATAVKGMIGLSFPALSVDENGHIPEGEEGTELTATPDSGTAGNGDAVGNSGGSSGSQKGSPERTERNRGTEVAEIQPVSEPEPEPDTVEETVALVDTTANQDPVVLIYHTHATESFQPVNSGNFHSVEEYGTVRQVGEEMAAALEARGIAVIHDKTLHDNPSYNQSYSKSLQTVNNYLAEYPSIEIVIDLHRDAASYTGNMGKTVTIDGNDVATYSIVIGKGNANVAQLRTFASKVNQIAEGMYPGFSNRVIEKEYRFNQYVADQYILLEVGNNENTIDQAKLTGKYFADVLEAYIQEMNQQ